MAGAADPREASAGAAAGAAPVSPRYLLTVLASGVGALAAFCLFLLGLGATGNLPPPTIANTLCVDEKLAFHRANPPGSPNLLVVGSSVAWRHFDGEAVARAAPGVEPLNGAFCGLRANQSAFAAEWLLDRLPSVREVLLIAAPQDFEDCRARPTAVFNREDADSFVFGNSWLLPFYLRYLDPRPFLRNIGTVAAQRRNDVPLDPLVFDRYGDGPLDTAVTRDTLNYGPVPAYDPACFAALRALARQVTAGGMRMMVATTPLHPEWKSRHDPDGESRAAFEAGLLDAITGTSSAYWDGDAAVPLPASAFTDGIHLRWSAAKQFSTEMTRFFRFDNRTTSLLSSQKH